MLQQKPRLTVKYGDSGQTTIFINKNDVWAFKTVVNSEIRKAESFASLLQDNHKRFVSYGGACKKNASQWLDLLKLGA